MTSDNIAINSTNFSVDKNGNMTCNNANVTGDITSSNAQITGGNINLKDSGTWNSGRIVAQNSQNNNQQAIFSSEGILIQNPTNDGYFYEANYGDSNFGIHKNINEALPYGISGSLYDGNTSNPYLMIWNNHIYTRIFSSEIRTPKVIINDEGPAMYGMNDHKYRCRWYNDRQLQFWVDDTNVGTLSDARLKTDIEDINEYFIKAIKEVEMKQFKVANRNGLVSFGILAQDLIEIFKKYNKNPFDYEIVQETHYKDDDDTIYYTINYEQFLVLKTKAQEQEIKELQAKDKEKDSLIENLIKRVEKLEKGE